MTVKREKKSAISPRGVIAIALCVLLPPLGLLFMWRNEVFRARGRLIMTALTAIELTIIFISGCFGLINWDIEPVSVYPVAGASIAVTRAPEDETLNALSNIEQLLAMRQPGETLSPDVTPYLTQEQQLALQREALNTVVYAVHRGAKLYHKNTVCGTQSNGRALTVGEAQMEGLAACPDCNPVSPSD